MLAPPKRPTDPHVATCDKSLTRTDVMAATFDEARKALAGMGWFEAARKGKKVQGWSWWCPRCKPTPATGSHGPSAGASPEG
jgi:hypothetical protein